MKVVFIACTPLAGAPIRIADALNKYTAFECRLITFNPASYGTRTFPGDLEWQAHKDECLQLIAQADILHFFHFIDFESENNPFKINFKKVAKNSVKCVRMFSSDLDFIARSHKQKELVLNDKYPKLVIPHCAERTFLDAFVVPNIIPINDEVLCPHTHTHTHTHTHNDVVKVFYSASSAGSINECRWNTKGLPEVSAKFANLRQRSAVKFDFLCIQNTPYAECQKIKRESDIVIGDTTSGSYHLTDLEALSQGKPTFTYLDNRSQMILQQLLRCGELPFINCRLEEIDLPFLELVKSPALMKEIGAFSRDWIERYYSEKFLVGFYETAYEKVLNGEPLQRQDCLKFPTAKRFLFNTVYDQQWETRIRDHYTKKKVQKKYPRWLVNFLCCFVPSRAMRKKIRQRFAA